MSSVFEKLQLQGETEIVVLNAPASLDAELAALEGVKVHRDVVGRPVHFALAFVTQQAELDALAQRLTDQGEGDTVLWFAYPKKTSKRFRCEFDRDTGWGVLGAAGYEGVRMIAIDEDWSALRWRKAGYIRSLRREPSPAPPAEGRRRTTPR